MISQNIRRKFLKYFQEKHHALLPSSPVVPLDDPTLLFTNAGMNQFKDLFLGKSHRSYSTAATSQKCIRVGGKHNDLENVGHTSRHLTFFEMLGNFSFGDYFKEQAITYAWEVSTQVFEFDPAKIWITIFQDDDEAFELWRKIAPEDRIVRLGEKDNFWAMGDTGPCGPCSELLYDRGSTYGNAPSPKEDTTGERFLEFWNLVFMQFNRDATGKMTPLPKQSIDTGSGLERVVSLKMGKENVFATDILRSLIGEIETVSGKKYDEHNTNTAPAYHVIADHIRSLSFAIADGAQPSNVDRGYVLRKLIRRAVRYGRMLGLQDPFLARILPTLIGTMGEDYPELKKAEGRIGEIITLEEEAFLRTLKRGGNILNTVIKEASSRPHKEITGEEAFKLKDTYGLPLEEILLIAKDSHLTVNLETYQLLEERAKELSRIRHVSHSQQVEENVYTTLLKNISPSLFTGYQELECEATIVALLKEGTVVSSLEAGEEGVILLDKTPFYAEKGGQIGDQGTLSSKDTLFYVHDCQNPHPGLITHLGKCEKGTLRVNQKIIARVEDKKRQKIQNNHTATHLLHWALQQVLGPHIRQAGSLVEATRLRFDFNHHKQLSLEELTLLEDLVNEKVRANQEVHAYELSYEDAQKREDIKQFFGDKYGKQVRVIDIAFSKELCGGTHTTRTGNIGYFRILKEGSVAAGVRRIEAVSGKEAEEWARQKEYEGHVKLTAAHEEQKKLLHEIKQLRRSSLKELAVTLAKKGEKIGSFSFLAAVVELESDELPVLLENLAPHLPASLILLALKGENQGVARCHLLLKLSPELVKKGLDAGKLIKELAVLIEGSGGGRAESAQAGGKKPSGVEEAFEKAKHYLIHLQ